VCGICGVVNVDRSPAEAARLVRAMTADLVRRGPDDEGTWVGAGGPTTALGFRRLAIVDPSPAGAQPMWSADGRAGVVFNGEIYNARELGRELEARGAQFRSTSDTEVLLAGLLAYGVDLLPRLRGMFAFALHRPAERTVLLARDHVGIKPLFQALEPGGPGLAFSSRYDSLFRTGWVNVDEIDARGLAAYLELKAVPAPGTLHRSVRQLPPGTWLEAGPDGVGPVRSWWELPPTEDRLRGDEAVDAVGTALDAAVRRHLVSDVPLGVFFSGGVDAPLVAGTAARSAPEALRAFTIGFPAWDQDEEARARSLAGELGLDLDVRRVVDPPPDVLDRVDAAQDEPVNDWSIVPTMLVSEQARSEVTVALSGDGGDELFFGYERPRSLAQRPGLWRRSLPVRRLRHLLGRVAGQPVSGAVLHRDPAAYYRSVHASAATEVLDSVAPTLAGCWPGPEVFAGSPAPDPAALGAYARERELAVQLRRVLRKVDMASMHHGLEVRVPLLDPDVISAAMQVDVAWTLRQPVGKPVLRALLDRLGATSAPVKSGFGAPVARWFAGPLRDGLGDRFAGELPFDLAGPAVRRLWAEQQDGRADHRRLLWGLAVLIGWRTRVRALVP